MGDLRPNNGGGTPPEDGGARPGDLPEFPPEWGTVVIPDDASELDAEAIALRREWRRHSRRARIRRLLGLPRSDRDSTSLGVPVVIMAVAVITTLLSLFVVTWDRRAANQPPGAASNHGQVSAAAIPTDAPPLSDVTLADASGTQIRLGSVLPAVILLAEGCDCATLITTIAAAMPASVTVVPIARTAPCAAGTAPNVRCLADTDGSMARRFPTASAVAGPPGSKKAAAVLVNGSGAASPPVAVDSPDDLAPALATLTHT